jgi:hypothetical protein
MAEAFKVPVAVFFFPSPPNLPPLEATFRTLPEVELTRIEPRIKLLLRKAKALQLNAEIIDGLVVGQILDDDLHHGLLRSNATASTNGPNSAVSSATRLSKVGSTLLTSSADIMPNVSIAILAAPGSCANGSGPRACIGHADPGIERGRAIAE